MLRNRPFGPAFGRTATWKAPKSALRPAFGRPESRCCFFPGSSCPAISRPGRPIYGLEAVLRNIECGIDLWDTSGCCSIVALCPVVAFLVKQVARASIGSPPPWLYFGEVIFIFLKIGNRSFWGSGGPWRVPDPEAFPKGGGASPPIFLKGLRGPRGRPDPPNDRFPTPKNFI